MGKLDSSHIAHLEHGSPLGGCGAVRAIAGCAGATMEPDYLSRTLDAAARALEKAGIAHYEIAASELFVSAVEVMDGQVHVAERSIERAAGIRLLLGGIGFAGMTEPTAVDLEDAIEEAIAEARRARPASIRSFAPPAAADAPPFLDPRATGAMRPILSELALELEAKTLAARPSIARVRPARVQEEVGTIALRTSSGLDVRETHSRASLLTGALAEDEDDAQSAYAQASAACAEGLAAGVAVVAEEAADRAARLLRAEPFETKRVPVIFGHEAVADIVALLAGALDAERLARGASFFAGKLGERVLSPLFTILDDPRDGSLDGACLFDGEGLLTYAKPLIDRGVVANLLDDRESAARAGRGPNAQAVRALAGGAPMPGAHSLILAPGARSAADLLRTAEGGIYVHELSGTHTVNEVTGELSLGAKGWRVREATWGAPIEGVTVSGRLVEMLSGDVELSRETRRLGGISVPILLIGDLQVSS